ncbi:hypothetical protein GA0061071_10798 [Kosakonia oryzendophytica]|uniref:Uncharacterized protein n=1 Tax=Kosakonia oryzendophytica TaxID=1005665 RepID=A0A1C4CBU3_9ENTR|nr:hypothetical protein GA0061071_10798 [Kosakonia oryzendophytica]
MTAHSVYLFLGAVRRPSLLTSLPVHRHLDLALELHRAPHRVRRLGPVPKRDRYIQKEKAMH